MHTIVEDGHYYDFHGLESWREGALACRLDLLRPADVGVGSGLCVQFNGHETSELDIEQFL